MGSLEGAGTVGLYFVELSVGSNNLSTEVGLITGQFAWLNKVGTGTLTLSAANTYGANMTGETVVKAGTLVVSGSIASYATVKGGTLLINGSAASPVQVQNGGTLGGGGTIAGAVKVANGGVLSPGTSAGNLSVGAGVEFDAGSIFRAELGGAVAGSGYDRLSVAGSVSLGAPTLDLRLINGFSPSLTSQQSFIIIDNDSTDAVSGTFAGIAQGATILVGDRFFSVSYTGGTGNDVIATSAGAYRVGGAGNDVLAGTAFPDTLDGRGGTDIADYSFLNSALNVKLKPGTQTVAGDTLISIEGVFGGTGNDSFKGTDKANIFRGGGGKDTLDGGGGSDTANYGDKGKAVQVKLDGAKAVGVKIGAKVEDSIKNIENVSGGTKGDKLGGDGNANIFDGGLGKDLLTGGGGKDKFVFSTALANSNVDTVTDFASGSDKIVLDDAIFAAIGGKLDKAEFFAKAGANKAHDGNDRIVYDTASGDLFYDNDGKSGNGAIHFATLSNHPSLSHGDFAIV